MSDQHPDGDDTVPVEPVAAPGRGDDTASVVVEVTRTGGFAGIPRTWRAAPEREAVPEWIALIDRCPWEEPVGAAASFAADRFAWDIRACTPDADRSAALDDAALTGAWRDLVDQVRAAASAR